MSGQAEYLIAAGAVLAGTVLTLVTALVALAYGTLEARHKRRTEYLQR